MNHEQTAFHQLAAHFGQSDIAFGLWICAFAILVIVAVFSIGIRWVKWTEDGDL